MLNYKTERRHVLHGMRETCLGFCLRVIVKRKPLNLEKTTSSVLSVLLLIWWLTLITLKALGNEFLFRGTPLEILGFLGVFRPHRVLSIPPPEKKISDPLDNS